MTVKDVVGGVPAKVLKVAQEEKEIGMKCPYTGLAHTV